MTTDTVLTTHAATGVSSFAWLLIALPLLGAAILLLGGKRTNRWGHLLGTAMSLSAFVVGALIFLQMLGRSTDQRAALAQINLPALVVGGKHDRITPPAALAWLAAALPRATAVQIERAGHAPFVSHPQDFAQSLFAFLSGWPA